MPPEDQSGLRPIARYAATDTDLDAVACATDSHLIIYVTGLVEGRRELVGLEILQQLPEGEEVAHRLEAAVETARRSERRPLSAEMMRRVPITPALEFRQQEARESILAEVRDLVQRVDSTHFENRREGQMAQYLPDVLAYVYAIRERMSPASLIAEARGVSVSSANSRIARSRMFGLLTSTGRAVAAGEATPEAASLLQALGVEIAPGGESE